ncbi:Uma2 family endonuclease [Streptomyces sp. NPDC050610]|uniref:Uma2 family endonuclease n=1 Tax=Streptomyces sp. NPDC050610 TaxID=3157097 RepID=UPI003431468B
MNYAYAKARAAADELLQHAPDAVRGMEIRGSHLILMMPRSGTHELTAWKLRRQLDQQVADGLAAHTGGGVEDASLGILCSPDLIVLPVAAMDTPGGFRPRDLLLAGEIVAPSAHIDEYAWKTRGYGAMGVPLYVVVDPREGTVAVMSDPGVGGDGRHRYRARHDYAFGDKAAVGPWTIDTSELPLYGPRHAS